MFVVTESSLGTDERAWLATPAVTDAPEMDWGPPGKVVVLSPHPDDETLAVGGTLAMLARHGFEIEIVAITDGEGSHPRSPTTTPHDLAVRRAREQRDAIGALGIVPMHRLGIADGAVARADLVARIGPLVRGARLVLAPWDSDGHPDHDAVGRAALACADRVVPYLVWAWHWARPNTGDLPWARLRKSVLDADARTAKARAIACFGSQIAPLSASPGDERVLPPAVLSRFARPFETVLAP